MAFAGSNTNGWSFDHWDRFVKNNRESIEFSLLAEKGNLENLENQKKNFERIFQILKSFWYIFRSMVIHAGLIRHNYTHLLFLLHMLWSVLDDVHQKL